MELLAQADDGFHAIDADPATQVARPCEYLHRWLTEPAFAPTGRSSSG